MDVMISQCGLICTECGAYIATKNDDQALREKTAAEWSQMYGGNITPEMIVCEGCLSTGKNVFGHCMVCEYRNCEKAVGIPNCAHCEDYACEKLSAFFAQVPDAKATLDKVHAALQG